MDRWIERAEDREVQMGIEREREKKGGRERHSAGEPFSNDLNKRS